MKIAALHGRISHAVASLCLLVLTFQTLAPAAHAQTVVATIPTPNPPGSPDVDPAAGRLYIPFQNQIDVVDENTNRVLRTITLGEEIKAVAVNPLTSRLYAADAFQGALYIIDTRTFATVATIDIPYARNVVVNPLTNRIYVSNSFYVFVIDGSTDLILSQVSLDGAEGLGVNPITNKIYIAQDVYPGAVDVLDGATNTISVAIPTGDDATFAVAVDFFRNHVYATNNSSITVINGANNTVTTSIADDGQPGGIVVDPVTNAAYINNEILNEVEIVNTTTNQAVGTINTGTFPLFSALDLYRGSIFVSEDGTPNGDGTFTGSGVSVIELPAPLNIAPGRVRTPIADASPRVAGTL